MGDFSLQEALAAIRARGSLILAIVILGVAAAVVYVWKTPKIYESVARIQVEQRGAKVVKMEEVTQEDLRSDAMLNTIVQSISARSLLRRVVVANDLVHKKDFLPDFEGTPTEETAVGALSGMVTAGLVKGTRLIDISVEHQRPAMAQLLAGSLVSEYIRQGLETRSKTSDVAKEFLMQQVDQVKERLSKAEKELQLYQETSKSVSIEERTNIVLEKVRELNTKLTEVRSQRVQLEADRVYLQQAGNDPEKILAAPSVARSAAIMELKKGVSDQEVAISALSERYRARHPEMLQARRKLEQLQDTLRQATLHAPAQIEASYLAAQQTERTFQTELDQLEQMALEVKRKSIEYNSLNRDLETDRTVYKSLLERLKETQVTGDLATMDLRVIEEPEMPRYPIKPAKFRILFLSLVASLTLGVGLAIGLASLDTSIKTVDQAESTLELPVVGAIPLSRKLKTSGHQLITITDPQDLVAEAFRTLRTSLLLRCRQPEVRSFAFTSAVASEGKSLCSVNYAVTLAQQGFRTLIIDADLRRPMIHNYFGLSRELLGVTEVLTGQTDFLHAVVTTSIDRLSVLPAGSIPTNAAELFGQAAFGEVIKQALLQYDRLVVDTAPVNLVSDTLLFANTIERVCLVVKAAETPYKVVRHALAALGATRVEIAGIVLNQIPQNRFGGYYYSYGSDKVYGSENLPAKR